MQNRTWECGIEHGNAEWNVGMWNGMWNGNKIQSVSEVSKVHHIMMNMHAHIGKAHMVKGATTKSTH